jgi:hypothetical protein
MSNCRLGSVHKEFETIQRCAARSGQPVAAGERGRARADLGHESDASVCQDLMPESMPRAKFVCCVCTPMHARAHAAFIGPF